MTCVANRDISNSCKCIPGFYAKPMPDTSTLCTPCGILCKTCSSLPNVCTLCYPPPGNRILNLGNNSCDCTDGYYDSKVVICPTC